jgi:hypothetical protein
MNRRSFAKSLSTGFFLLLAFGSTVFLGGCNAVSDLENWIPVGLTALAAIVKLLGPLVPPQVAAAIAIVQAAFSAVLTAIKNYKAGTGVLSDIANAIAAVESAFQSFFASLNVPQSLLDIIEGLGEIIISTIQGFANEIGPAPVATAVAVSIGGNKTFSVKPAKRSLKQFKHDWNAQCVKFGHPESQL